MSPAWRRFTQADWYGLAGSESFPGEGGAPFIADVVVDGYEGTLVWDAQGLCAMWTSEPDAGNEDGVEHVYALNNEQGAVGVAHRLEAATTRAKLRALGFRGCT